LTPPSADVLGSVRAIAAGDFHTCALMLDGGMRCWGSGQGETSWERPAERTTPPASDALTSVQAIAAGADHTCALLAGGGVRCWGDNEYGQVGLPRPDHSRPTPVRGILCR
jgi:alpha-tubulin suppressor-like RCC1 family protein